MCEETAEPTHVLCGRKPPGAGKVSASMRGYADSRQLHPTLGLAKRLLGLDLHRLGELAGFTRQRRIKWRLVSV